MRDALDYLDELCDDDDYTNIPQTIFLQPPQYDGNISGEDDAEDDDGGLPDNVCPQQLNTPCEMVMSNGERLDGIDESNDFSLGLFHFLFSLYSFFNHICYFFLFL